MQSGNQDRPDIFDLEIKKPDLLYETVVEVDQRVRMVVLEVLDVEVLRPRLQTILDQGIRSLAVVFMHAYASEHESASAHPGPVCYRKKRAPCRPRGSLPHPNPRRWGLRQKASLTFLEPVPWI